MYVQLNYEHDLVDRYQAEEEFGCWGEDYTFDGPTRGRLSPDYGEPILDSAQPGQTFYAVMAVWSCGDSYGCANNSSVDVVSVYPDMQQAQAVVDQLRQHTEQYQASIAAGRYNYDCRCHIQAPDGRPYVYGVPWLGYFETLQVLEVFPIILE